jgi:hypothetical protein
MTLELESYRSKALPVLCTHLLTLPVETGNARRFPIGGRISWLCILSNLDQLEVETAFMRRKQSGLANDPMAAFRQGNARHMSKDEARSRHTSAGASSKRLDTDVAAPASSGGQAVTRLSLRSESAPAGGGSTPSTPEVMPQLGGHPAPKSLTKSPTLCPRNLCVSQAQWRILAR